MIQPPAATKIQLLNTPEYRENYANSVQVRVNLWDFFLMFGRVNQTAPDQVAIHNFEGVYLSPQQAKALLNVLQQNVTQYETAFGEIRLEPQAAGPVGAVAVQACAARASVNWPAIAAEVFKQQNHLVILVPRAPGTAGALKLRDVFRQLRTGTTRLLFGFQGARAQELGDELQLVGREARKGSGEPAIR